MEFAHVGSLRVSAIGLGCNNFGRSLDREQSAAVIHTALEHGITFFDTARTYGNGRSESFLADALGSHRDEVVVATKFGRIPRLPDSPGAGRAGIRSAVEQSLRALQTDRIDLYQLHFPDPDVPISETLETLAGLVGEGKVREIGCANFDAVGLSEALGVSADEGRPSFVSDQVHYSMVHREPEEDGLSDLCRDAGVALLPYYPLASGLLTGKTRRDQEPRGRLAMERYNRFLTDDNFDLVEVVGAFARERDLTLAQVALRWLLTRPAVRSVTPGATRPEQVVANVAAIDWDPASDDVHELDSMLAAVSTGITRERASRRPSSGRRPRSAG